MNDTMDITPKLRFYSLAGDYITTIDYQPIDRNILCQNIETVVLLDRSGSMGQSVTRIGTKILPLFFQKLNYAFNEKIHLITFDDVSEYRYLEIKELSKLQEFKARGGTCMSVGVQTFHEIVKKLAINGTKLLRILTTSDGEVFDGQKTIKEAEKVAEFLNDYEIAISSKTVRWFTSSCEPDTTALCCLMQLNNNQESKMLDIRSDVSFEEAASAWAAMFETDGLFNVAHLVCKSPVFLKYPWDSKPSNSTLLFRGKNVFWSKDIPENLKLEGRSVDVEIYDSISYHHLQDLLGDKVDCISSQMKILKIVKSTKTSETIQKILEYFKKIEAEVPKPPVDLTNDGKNLKNRIKLLKFRLLNQKFSTILEEIANDNMVHNLNAAQKAAYLRHTMISRGSKSLARRSTKCTGDLEFDEIARKEALKIAEHFHEIADIDDSEHEISFYSQATTFEGIKTLIEFTKDKAFSNASVLEILEVLNIVGVACNGPVANYPDPSTWIIDKIYPSCFVSIGDILSVLNQSEHNKLFVPAYAEEITNSIPIFNNPRIGSFLKRYGRSLLEFTCSIGMRQMIAVVPKTVDYTMIAGIRCMIDVLSKDKATKNLEIFKNMVTTLENFAGRVEVAEFLVPQVYEKYGYFLDNSGISEMLVPFIRILRQNKQEIVNEIPAMLRSIYNYEIWLHIRRNYKRMEGCKEIIKEMLLKLLEIDIERHKINVEEPSSGPLVFYDDFKINSKFVNDLTDNLKHLNIVALIPDFLDAVINERLENVKKVPTLDSNSFLKALDINYSYDKYMFLNVFQALVYTNKKERCDIKHKTMKVIDLKNYEEAVEDVKSYVKNLFQKQYEFDMSRKTRMDEIRLGNTKMSEMNHKRFLSQLQREPAYAKMAVKKIIESKNYSDMIDAWRNGIKCNERTFKIIGPGYFGFRLLKFALGTLALDIPLRLEIIQTLLLGVDRQNQEVWNGGKHYITVYGRGLRYYRAAFLYTSTFDEWDNLKRKHSYV